MNRREKGLASTALQANIEKTAAVVEIPEKQQILLRTVDGLYGVYKRTKEFLDEFNHPYINWEFVVERLKTISLGDFYKHNAHKDGINALKVIVEIYFDIIRLAPGEDVKERALKYLFDYIENILSNSKDHLPRNLSLIPFIIKSLAQISNQNSFLKKSSTYLKPILKFLITNNIAIKTEGLKTLLYNVFRSTYEYWLTQPDPKGWSGSNEETKEAIENFEDLIEPLSHHNLTILLDKLEAISGSTAVDKLDALASYLDMPDHFQIVKGYLLVADELERADIYAGHQHLVKLNFLFKIINVKGLSDIHGTTLREINRSLSMVFKEESPEKLNVFVKQVFNLLKKSTSRYQYQDTIINCIITVAKEIFKINDHALVDTFIEQVISFGFQYPDIQGSTTDWQVKVNPIHVKNIRAWLEIIALRPRWTKRLLSALIINLKIGGIFVSDTDLLQKDISALLNSDIKPSYNLVKQLARIFPIYFSEIGAEGELRDISTKIDELSFRSDNAIHFLRKQSHVESNSLLVPFVENIFRYWYSGDKENMKGYLPDEVYNQIVNSGEYFDGAHKIFKVILEKIDHDPHKFLEWDKSKIQKEINGIKGVMDRDKERAILLIRLYQLLYKKYNPEHIDLLQDLESAHIFSPSKIRSLKRSLKRNDYYRGLSIILEFLNILKERILSPKRTESFENIYHKRHIAAGIPSMYGTYREEKFDALSLSLRLESLANVLFEQMIVSLNLKFITKSTLAKIHKYLWLFIKALDLEGIAKEGLEAKMKFFGSALQVKLFSVDQYINIFQFVSRSIQDIIRNYYIDAHRSNLPIIINQSLEKKQDTGEQKTSPKDEEAVYQISENFIRSMISSAFGLQALDNFISNILRALSTESERLKDRKEILNLLMTYDPDITISPIYQINKKTDDQIHLGNKGYFLKKLASFHFPVPPGFIITTEVFRCFDAVVGYKYISKDLSLRIYNELLKLQKITGRRFGDPENPLLLSVRSGAAVSLPGMMNSFLNVGINESIAEGLSKRRGYRWAAWDSYRRFLQIWGMFQGLERDFFDQIIDDFKSKYKVIKKIQFSADQMKQVALTYRKVIEEKGIEVVDDPAEQLRHAVLRVFESWNSTRAKIYRHQMNIADEWGTAVVVQAMVFGNLNRDSGSGVVFTRNPRGLSPAVTLYGDFIFGVQGDDIVSGLVETYPISENQRKEERRDSEISLEKEFPEIYFELSRLCEKLVYERGLSHQQIEFTFENAKKEGLYVLQTRDMAPIEQKKLKFFKDTGEFKESLLGIGVGVGGGALCGRVVYSEEEIKFFRKKEPETALILIRPDTVPDDVGLLLQVDGLLTAKGGSTSHAAVTIPQLKKVGVVGFKKLKVYETRGYSVVDGHIIKGGTFIGIDGWSGTVYLGKHEVESEESYIVNI
ncbi:MAG: pyruvate, phosphate dikinase [Deltaproteobacteria bacterium]|nr:pyruvate, phosphate dikinase [Deltaproteobacteria bacterium]